MDYGLRSETVLPIRVHPQPHPHLYPGGDCGSCVVGGLLGWSPQRVYDSLCDGESKSIHRGLMCAILHEALAKGLLDRLIVESPVWLSSWMGRMGDWGPHSGLQSTSWFNYLRMAFDAGYYAIACVDHSKSGIHGPGPDHWVLLCGSRESAKPISNMTGAAVIVQELLVSCSSKSTPDEEWVEVSEFLRDRGGFNTILVRPSRSR